MATILPAIATAVASAAASALIGKALSSDKPQQAAAPAPTILATPSEPPKVEPEVAMPVPDDKAAMAAQRKQTSRRASSSTGRASTILTADEDLRLGG